MTLFRRLAAVLALSAVFLTAAPTPVEAAPSDGATYVVQPGDFLIGIARDHGVSLGALLVANDLTAFSLITPGDTLVIPGSTPPATPATPAPSSGGDVTGAPGSTYTVVAGDALSLIAARHGVSLTALLRANGLSVTSLIVPGRTLTIPAGGTTPAAPSTPAAEPAGTASPEGAAPTMTYTVVPGDALSLIALRHGVSLSALLRENGLTVSSMIYPGRELRIPAGGTAPAGGDTGPSPTTAAPAPSASRAQRVVDYALAQVGKPYKFFTSGPASFDCSGLTLAAYAQVGISLIHFSAAQALQGTPVDVENEAIRPGDLVFLARPGTDVIHHVGIAISSTKWVHAPGTGDTVRTGWMPAKSSIAEVRRLVDD